MKATRLLMLLAAVLVATNSLAAATDSDAMLVPPPLAYTTDYRLLAPTFSSSQLGLKTQSERARAGIALPFGLNYNEETKVLLMNLDRKNEWGVGVNLDLNPSRPIELAPPSSPLGLQPKRAPGFMLERRF